ncbi:hypothetical protein [Actinomadura fibrosa]|uniref:ATP-binding protein n=1 Tax=Actinomadura fibrosa TaxID=111802 RepID=A0ABW2XEW1_9ACTN|nr:hypothetical protein [Actinomadura fibrosa]
MAPEDVLFEEVISAALDERYIERQWLADLVERHLADPGCRFVLLLGGPGTGKTSFVSWMTRRHEVSPRYFVRRDSVGSFAGGDARSVLLRIGHQLAVLVPHVMGRDVTATVAQQVGKVTSDGSLVGIRVGLLQTSPFRRTALRVTQQASSVQGTVIGLQIDHLITDPRLGDLGNLQYLALLDPAVELAHRTPGALIVLFVDALDELRHQVGFFGRGESVLDWLAQVPQLPDNIRIILTSRPDESLHSLRIRQRPWLREETLTDST